MARSLVLVPPSSALLIGALPIGAGYPGSYTPQQMRVWADDLEQLYRTVEADRAKPPGQRRLDAWIATPRDQLAPEARRVVEAHEKLLSEPSQGIRGSLLADGRVELDAGRHRAHYALERGSGPVPVWVSSPDAQRLEAFRASCHEAVERSRPGLMNPDRGELRTRALGRAALDGAAAEPDRSSERHLTREFGERTRERGRFLHERDR